VLKNEVDKVRRFAEEEDKLKRVGHPVLKLEDLMLLLGKKEPSFSLEHRREIVDLQVVADEEKPHRNPIGIQNGLTSMTRIVAAGTKMRLLKVVEEMSDAIEVGTATGTVSAAVEMTTQKTTRTRVEEIRQTAALRAVVTTIEREIAGKEKMDQLTFQDLAVVIIMVATVLHLHIAVTTTHCRIPHLHLQDRPVMTIDGVVVVAVARTATETAIEIVAAAEEIVNETSIATTLLAVVISLSHANVAALAMTIMDMETAVHVECAWEVKVKEHVVVHNRPTRSSYHDFLFFHDLFVLFSQFLSIRVELFSFVYCLLSKDSQEESTKVCFYSSMYTISHSTAHVCILSFGLQFGCYYWGELNIDIQHNTHLRILSVYNVKRESVNLLSLNPNV
jgi:hypothetical protein